MKKKDNKTPNNQEDKSLELLMDDIREEIKNENWKKLWDKYGKTFSYVAAVMIVGASIYNMWKKHDLEERYAISRQFTKLQYDAMAGYGEQALTGFKEIEATGKKDYDTLAKFEIASILNEKKDKEAIAVYKNIAETAQEKVIRDLAHIYQIGASLNILDDEELKDQCPAFINDLSTNLQNGPFGLLAREYLAYCYIKQGEKGKAKETIESLIKDEKTPGTLGEKLKVVLSSLNW